VTAHGLTRSPATTESNRAWRAMTPCRLARYRRRLRRAPNSCTPTGPSAPSRRARRFCARNRSVWVGTDRGGAGDCLRPGRAVVGVVRFPFQAQHLRLLDLLAAGAVGEVRELNSLFYFNLSRSRISPLRGARRRRSRRRRLLPRPLGPGGPFHSRSLAGRCRRFRHRQRRGRDRGNGHRGLRARAAGTGLRVQTRL